MYNNIFMKKIKKVYSIKINGFEKFGKPIEFSIFGSFDMHTMLWDNFFACSHQGDKTTEDLYSISGIAIGPKFAKFIFSTKKEAIQFLDDFKLKWELESNDVLSYQREKKLDDLTK